MCRGFVVGTIPVVSKVCQDGVVPVFFLLWIKSEWECPCVSAMAKPGLYENIRRRRAAGKKPRKPGSKGAPTAADFRAAAKTAKPKPKTKKK